MYRAFKCRDALLSIGFRGAIGDDGWPSVALRDYLYSLLIVPILCHNIHEECIMINSKMLHCNAIGIIFFNFFFLIMEAVIIQNKKLKFFTFCRTILITNMKEYVSSSLFENTCYRPRLSLNNFENDDYFFNQLRSCHVTFAEGGAISARRHDVQRCPYIVHHSVLYH